VDWHIVSDCNNVFKQVFISLKMDLEGEIIKYIAEKTDIKKDNLSRASRFSEDLAMDSLDMVEMTMDIEQKYGVNILDKDFDKMRTIGDVADYISERYKGNDEKGDSAKI